MKNNLSLSNDETITPPFGQFLLLPFLPKKSFHSEAMQRFFKQNWKQNNLVQIDGLIISSLLILFFLLLANVLLAQSPMLEKKVTIQYFDVKLEDALDNISKDYDVNFSYSIDRISVHQKVSADVEDAPLSLALEDLLEETNITYAGIGDQVVLKVDKKKILLSTQRKSVPIKKEVPVFEIPKPVEVPQRAYVFLPQKIESVSLITVQLQKEEAIIVEPEMAALDYVKPNKNFDFELYFDIDIDLDILPFLEEEEILAQVTLFGTLGTNLNNNSTTTNKVSANIIYGKSGGVNGTEVGGLVNAVVNDVNGIQVAGIGNVVGGNVTGTQVGGIFNVNQGEVKGIQAAGIVNVGRETKGVQVAGFLNVSKKGSNGIQAAGLGNIAGSDSKRGIQAAGLFNINRGTTNLQAAGIINIGNEVKGFQIGLINIADTVGASIGLINIVRKGYNRLELSGSEFLNYNMQLKLGSRKFYNMFHFGLNLNPINGSGKAFGFGYGFGTVIKKRKSRWSNNLELLATQIRINDLPEINPSVPNTHQLNLLTQLRWSLDCRLGRRASIFLGPTFNVITSKHVDAATGDYEYVEMIPRSIFEKKITGINPLYLGGWIGFNAGIRF